MPRTRHHRTAFTVIETAVVIAIIGVMMAIALPAISVVRESANRSRCANHLRQIGLAVIHFDTERQDLPPAFGIYPRATLPNRPLANHWAGSLFFHILPYVGEQNVFESSKQSTGSEVGSYRWTNVNTREIKVFVCPSDPTYNRSGLGCYASNVAAFPLDDRMIKRLSEFPDGSAHVAIIAEKCSRQQLQSVPIIEVEWGGPNSYYMTANGPPVQVTSIETKMGSQVASTPHVRLQFVTADGAVHRLTLDTQAYKVWQEISSPNDGISPPLE